MSVTGIAWRAYNRGEISTIEMQTMIALDCADTLHDHPLRAYPISTIAHEQYVHGRIMNVTKRDASMARHNGEWLYATRVIYTENSADIDTLMWARDLCLKNKAEGRAARIAVHLKKYEDLALNYAFLDKALRVQTLDSYEKQREGRGKNGRDS